MAAQQQQQVDELRATVRLLSAAVQEALLAAQAAQRDMRKRREDEAQARCGPSPALTAEAVQERLSAFETYIIRRVREETTRVPPNSGAARSSAGPTADAPAGSRRLEIQLEAQRTRTVALEQRLAHLEAKLNAMMADVVAQAQTDATQRRQLVATVDAKIQALTAAETEANSSRRAVEEADLPLLQHVLQAMAAMHARVEEQHAQLNRWHEQNYQLMLAVVAQMRHLENENAGLLREMAALRQHIRRE